MSLGLFFWLMMHDDLHKNGYFQKKKKKKKKKKSFTEPKITVEAE